MKIENPADPAGVSLDVHEFAKPAGRRRLTLHEEQGLSTWTLATIGPAPSDQWRDLTLDKRERDVRIAYSIARDRVLESPAQTPYQVVDNASRHRPILT